MLQLVIIRAVYTTAYSYDDMQIGDRDQGFCPALTTILIFSLLFSWTIKKKSSFFYHSKII